MDLEFHQLDLRYDPLRTRHVRKERQLLASLAVPGRGGSSERRPRRGV
jgi:hypothetical protein